MDERQGLAGRFETDRPHLRSVAYRMLGSLSEAEDAVQETWLRLSRSEPSELENLSGWLTTVIGRVCLDMLRARRARREEPVTSEETASDAPGSDSAVDPQEELDMAESVGLALLVVLEALEPAERVAFVLHDLFDLTFDEIAPIVGRSSVATRQLASRARRKVRGAPAVSPPQIAQRLEVVEAFLDAARGGNFDALLTALDPNVVFRPDMAARLPGPSTEVRGAAAVAKLFSGRAQAARVALVNGDVGVVVVPSGRLLLALALRVVEGRIAEIEVIAERSRLSRLELSLVPGPDARGG